MEETINKVIDENNKIDIQIKQSKPEKINNDFEL